jgi:hypothetical protein
VGKSPAEERHRAGEVPRLGMAGEERGVEQGRKRATMCLLFFFFFYLMCLLLDASGKTVLRPLLFNCFKNYGVYTCAVECLTCYQLIKF